MEKDKTRTGVIFLDAGYYLSNPALMEYFVSLPPAVKEFILQSDIEISTPGELMKIGEHLTHEL